jgi:hypothetical protein
VFQRYREIRAREREYLDWPDPVPVAEPAHAAASSSEHAYS